MQNCLNYSTGFFSTQYSASTSSLCSSLSFLSSGFSCFFVFPFRLVSSSLEARENERNERKEKEVHKDDIEALYCVEKNQLSDSDNSAQIMQHQYWLRILEKTYTDDDYDI